MATDHVAARATLEAAEPDLAREREGATIDLSSVRPIVVAPAPFDYAFVAPAPSPKGPVPRLAKVFEAKNGITDDEAWFDRNGLAPLALEPPSPARKTGGKLPPGVPAKLGELALAKAIVDAQTETLTLLYGEDRASARIVARLDERGAVAGVFDFSAWRRPPRELAGDEAFVGMAVQWVVAQGGVLFVSHGHLTYAKSSYGKNAYVTALDLETGRLLWRSQPLVSNAASFVVHGPVIFAGYGFTAEPDFVYVLDRRAGKVIERIRVASGPSFLVEKAGRLFVRCYDTDYVFAIED